MIIKLRRKITLIVLCAISIPFLIIISFYSFSYYNNTIKTNSGFVDRFIGKPAEGPNKEDKKFDFNEIDGIYSISVNNGIITNKSNNVSKEIEKYTLKIIEKNNDHGIINNYIYSKRVFNEKNNDMTITFIESKNEINKIKIVFSLSVLIIIIGLIIIYYIAKKVASFIVKPVEETFNKQRDFISDASHEFKTPLAVIRANADVLESDIGKNKRITFIQNEIDNMSKLISEMLLLTKIENIDKLRKPEKFNMSNEVELIVSSFESMAYEKNIKIENNIQKDIITTNFNKDDIMHILSTLIDNSIKHTEEKKKVIVELIKNKDKIIINIKNKGEEIPISEREKIFDRFYRIDKSRNRNEKRYGLGLSIAKAIVLKNNGTIEVDYINGYTIFKVELPL